jgi:hypothetical protein
MAEQLPKEYNEQEHLKRLRDQGEKSQEFLDFHVTKKNGTGGAPDEIDGGELKPFGIPSSSPETKEAKDAWSLEELNNSIGERSVEVVQKAEKELHDILEGKSQKDFSDIVDDISKIT